MVSAVVICGLVVLLLVLQTKEDGNVADVSVSVQSEQRQDSLSSKPEEVSSDTGDRGRKRRKATLPKNAIDRKKRAEVLALILSALQGKVRTDLPCAYISNCTTYLNRTLKCRDHRLLSNSGNPRACGVPGYKATILSMELGLDWTI
jgi:hypothetical protein